MKTYTKTYTFSHNTTGSFFKVNANSVVDALVILYKRGIQTQQLYCVSINVS